MVEVSEIILSRETQVSVYTIFLCFFPLASFLLSGCQTFLKSHQYKLRYFFTSYIYKCHLRVCYLLTRVERRFCDILHGESCAGIVPRRTMLRQYANPNPIYIYTIKYLPRVLKTFHSVALVYRCGVSVGLFLKEWKEKDNDQTNWHFVLLIYRSNFQRVSVSGLHFRITQGLYFWRQPRLWCRGYTGMCLCSN